MPQMLLSLALRWSLRQRSANSGSCTAHASTLMHAHSRTAVMSWSSALICRAITRQSNAKGSTKSYIAHMATGANSCTMNLVKRQAKSKKHWLLQPQLLQHSPTLTCFRVSMKHRLTHWVHQNQWMHLWKKRKRSQKASSCLKAKRWARDAFKFLLTSQSPWAKASFRLSNDRNWAIHFDRKLKHSPSIYAE